MTSDESVQQVSPSSLDDLAQQLHAARQELAELKIKQQLIWPLVVDTSRKLQISSASIKAAVSSLLNYDIFWDGANQHEFLTTIDTSVEQVAKLVTLLALVARSEEGSLELKREPHDLLEIISVVQDSGSFLFPKLTLEIALPNEGRPVLVDYEYLTTALELLCEVCEAALPSPRIRIQASEAAETWHLDFGGLNTALIQLVEAALGWQVDKLLTEKSLTLDHLLRLYIVRQILALQGIQVEALPDVSGESTLRLQVPVAASTIAGRLQD